MNKIEEYIYQLYKSEQIRLTVGLLRHIAGPSWSQKQLSVPSLSFRRRWTCKKADPIIYYGGSLKILVGELYLGFPRAEGAFPT